METFITESLIRNAAWVNSGEIFTDISIGTKIEERIAHFEVAEVIIIFKSAVRINTPKMVIPDGICSDFKNSAPDKAINVPSPERLNEYKNWAQKKETTINGTSV